jgi:hypothetical protein
MVALPRLPEEERGEGKDDEQDETLGIHERKGPGGDD